VRAKASHRSLNGEVLMVALGSIDHIDIIFDAVDICENARLAVLPGFTAYDGRHLSVACAHAWRRPCDAGCAIGSGGYSALMMPDLTAALSKDTVFSQPCAALSSAINASAKSIF
jgi:hypothetical protein